MAEGALFLISGKLTELTVELGKENLLAKVDKHYRGKSLATGAVAAVGDLFGQVANAAMLALYDGEDTQSFLCFIDGQIVCGQFGGAEVLVPDSHVEAVVSRQGGVLVAHAIKIPSSGLLLISHPLGVSAERNANFRFALLSFVGGVAATSIVGTMVGLFSPKNANSLLVGLVLFGLICLGMALWTNSDMKALAEPSTNMFRLLGFNDPERVNLSAYGLRVVSIREHLQKRTESDSTEDLAEYQHRNVYCYQKAIEDRKLSIKG
jgi:hypothetical protein